MKKIERVTQTATFSIDVPLMANQQYLNVNHQISLAFSAACNSGMTLTVTATPYGTTLTDSVDGGTLDCYALRGTQKTLVLQASVLESLTFTIAGRTTGSVSLVYLGYAAIDKGLEV